MLIFDGQEWISLNFKKFVYSYCRTRFDWLWSNTKIDLFTKPKTNHPAIKKHNGNKKAEPGKKSASHGQLKY